MAEKWELAKMLWREVGISWGELDQMDPADVEKIKTIYRIDLEMNGPRMRGCPMMG